MRSYLTVVFSLSVLCSSFLSAQANEVVTDEATVHFYSEVDAVRPGERFWVAMDFELKPHWHVYWVNPGASGLPLELDWDLPEGLSAGEIQWPVPERIELGGLINYGYEDGVTFLVSIDVADTVEPAEALTIVVDAFWLICKEVCLPAEGRFELQVPVVDRPPEPINNEVFASARASHPQPSAELPWHVGAVTEAESLVIRITQKSDEVSLPESLYFYSENSEVVDVNAPQVWERVDTGVSELRMPLVQSFMEDPLLKVGGVLQTNASSWSVELDLGAGHRSLNQLEVTSYDGVGGFEAFFLNLGLPGWLLLAFLGGMILNVMPCVLPVLSLKVFSLLKHSGQTKQQALMHGLAYTGGVVLSFLCLAVVLLLLRALGERIGWGFQLQSPGFVVVLALLFFLFALNLMGVFELGSSLVGADTEVSKRNDLVGSFSMGILAAVVGAPCVGPLLASVGGIAVQAPPLTGLLIFGMMGFGLAAPFLVLAIFPNLVAYLPKPGAWMESVKQFMGFLLIAAVLFLISVVGASGGTVAIKALLISLFVASLAAWVYGRWGAPVKSLRSKRVSLLLSLILLLAATTYGVQRVGVAYAKPTEASSKQTGQWAAWSESRVESELAAGNPVFVDFTASWCLICQVNKARALRTDATAKLFEEAGVVALEADWSRYDPEITSALEKFGRSGVPLYLLYSTDGNVQVLPQSLNQNIITEAVEKLTK